MAIDRIGKGTGLPAPPETNAPGKAAATDKPFRIERTEPVDRTSAATSTDASARASSASHAASVGALGTAPPLSALERFRAGEVDVNGYIDLEVDSATASLEGLPPSSLDEIKSLLRDQMKSDPGLADLVRTATGQLPNIPDEG